MDPSFGAFISLLSSSSFFECNSVGSFSEGFQTLIISSAILLPIKSPVASTVFWIALFEAVFIIYLFIYSLFIVDSFTIEHIHT